jgi:hypothetical protein
MKLGGFGSRIAEVGKWNWKSETTVNIQFSIFNGQFLSEEDMSEEFEPNIIAFCCDY